MRTVILSHPYQACWTIINSPWLAAGQEPVSVQHWLQRRSPLTWRLKSAGWWRALRGRGPLLQKKKCSNCQSRTSLSVWLQHRLSNTITSCLQDWQSCTGRRFSLLICKALWSIAKRVWAMNILPRTNWRGLLYLKPLQCIGAVTDIHFLFWSSGDSWECVSRRSVTFCYGQCAFFIITKQQPHWSFWGVVIPSLRQHLCKSNLQICPECWPTLQ